MDCERVKVSITGTDFERTFDKEQWDAIVADLEENGERRRGREHVSQPAMRFLFRVAQRADRLQVESVK